MLIQQLRDLEQNGIVTRTVYPQVPPKVEYGLTDLERALGPVFLALLAWSDLRSAQRETSRLASTGSRLIVSSGPCPVSIS
jgi:DNA-binding HxlR family transcriptional regulator